MGTRTYSRRASNGERVLTPAGKARFASGVTSLSVPVNQITPIDSRLIPVGKGIPIAVHHVTTAANANSIVNEGKFMPRNKPNTVMLFGATDGGYFGFEHDPETTTYYQRISGADTAVVSATITPQKPLVVRNMTERTSARGEDWRQGTRSELIRSIIEALDPADVAPFNSIMKPYQNRINAASVADAQYRFIADKLPPYQQGIQQAEVEGTARQASDLYINAALKALKKLGYDALVITQPQGTASGADLVGGNQVLALTPDIVTVHGIRPNT